MSCLNDFSICTIADWRKIGGCNSTIVLFMQRRCKQVKWILFFSIRVNTGQKPHGYSNISEKIREYGRLGLEKSWALDMGIVGPKSMLDFEGDRRSERRRRRIRFDFLGFVQA